MRVLFQIPIGDWAGDGHEKCAYFSFVANCTIDTLREVYFKVKQDNPEYCPENFLNRFQHRWLEDKEFNFITDKFPALLNGDYDREDEEVAPTDRWFALFVVEFLKLGGVEIEPIEIPMLPFYGRDAKDRHIGTFGYGLF